MSFRRCHHCVIVSFPDRCQDGVRSTPNKYTKSGNDIVAARVRSIAFSGDGVVVADSSECKRAHSAVSIAYMQKCFLAGCRTHVCVCMCVCVCLSVCVARIGLEVQSMDCMFVCRFCYARVGLEVQSMDCMFVCRLLTENASV